MGLDRRSAVMQIVEDTLLRRLDGEAVSDQMVLDAHPDLMPELGVELAGLHLVEDARTRAASKDPLPTGDDAIPGYRILREVHRGGQGVVFRARRLLDGADNAIKMLRTESLGSETDLARFEREVQVLRSLDHPRIVRIHDSGTYDGATWYAMDYIDGTALDDHVAARAMTVREVLNLIVRICDAVHAAHLNGVIHRDLKPGNIRVDAQGEPRVLDFGLARSAFGAGTTTLTGQFVGSIPWASPEQAAGARLDIRTDVYSLGVILYHLLTGHFPYEVMTNIHDALKNIINTEPDRLRKHRPDVSADVETILRTCLNKDPDRRYQSAGELGRDIERYLRGDAIEARRDGLWYLTRQIMKQHTGPFTIVLAFFIMLAIAAAAFAWQTTQARRAEALAMVAHHEAEQARNLALRAQREAEEHRLLAEQQRDLARQAEQTAASEAEKTRAVTQFMQEMLTSVDPAAARGREVTISEVLEQASAEVDQFAEQPQVEAGVRNTIGSTYLGLGRFDDAEAHYLRALESSRTELGETHPHTRESMLGLARTWQAMGRHAEALRLFEELLARAPDVEAHAMEAGVRTAYASLLQSVGRLEESELHGRQAVDQARRLLGEDHPTTLRSLQGLASTLYAQGRSVESEELLRDVFERRRRVLGVDHAETIDASTALVRVLLTQGRNEEASILCREALMANVRLFGAEHPRTLDTQHELAHALAAMNQHEEAEAMLLGVIERRRIVLSPQHPSVLEANLDLANLYIARGRPADAVPLLEESLGFHRAVGASDAPATRAVISALAEAYRDLGRVEEAAVLLQSITPR